MLSRGDSTKHAKSNANGWDRMGMPEECMMNVNGTIDKHAA
jgi:hypothetical protein